MKKMKSKFAKICYSALIFIDKKTGKHSEYSYETAPYCGHHFSGHKGFFTNSQYNEGIGGCNATLFFGIVEIYKNSEEYEWNIWINLKTRKK
jgi:hypothetical protein